MTMVATFPTDRANSAALGPGPFDPKPHSNNTESRLTL
jgi:hypothetical protein